MFHVEHIAEWLENPLIINLILIIRDNNSSERVLLIVILL